MKIILLVTFTRGSKLVLSFATEPVFLGEPSEAVGPRRAQRVEESLYLYQEAAHRAVLSI